MVVNNHRMKGLIIAGVTFGSFGSQLQVLLLGVLLELLVGGLLQLLGGLLLLLLGGLLLLLFGALLLPNSMVITVVLLIRIPLGSSHAYHPRRCKAPPHTIAFFFHPVPLPSQAASCSSFSSCSSSSSAKSTQHCGEESLSMALWWLFPTHQLVGVALASQWLAFVHPAWPQVFAVHDVHQNRSQKHDVQDVKMDS